MRVGQLYSKEKEKLVDVKGKMAYLTCCVEAKKSGPLEVPDALFLWRRVK